MAQGLEGLLSGHTLVKRYKIEEVCGRGGFAVVYRATDTRLGRPVAVKVITLTAEDPEQREVLRQRLHREARAAASLPHHPNLVTVHDVGTDPELGLDFLVMELLEGENLSQVLQRERPPTARALTILRDAAEGLAIGHRAGLVHRDVKPANIFLARAHRDDPDAFRVCLLDYGIAMAIEDDQTVTRGMGANPLSPAFASPEQLAGSRDLSPATDVFSLGVVGYQLLTGERPFVAEAGQVPTGWTVRQSLRELNPEVTPAVEDVILQAMSVDPKDRYPDADVFAEALDVASGADDVTQGLAAKAHSPGVGALVLDDELEDDSTMIAPAPRVAAPAAAGVAAAAGAPRQRPVPPLRPPARDKPRRGSKMPIVLVVALLLVAAAAWAALSGGGGDDRTEARTPAEGDAPGGTASTIVDDAGNPVETSAPSRTGVDVDVPPGAPPTGGSPVSEPAGSGPSTSAPSTGSPSTGAPSVVTTPSQPSRPAPQQPRPQPQPQRPPAAQPQPQRPAPQQQPAASPPAQQPSRPQPQPQRPPAQQPRPQPQPQPQRPPVQQPQPQPQQPPVQQPPPPPPVIQPPQPRPEPPLLGQPVPPRPDAPRDTIFFPAPPGAARR